MGDTQSAQRADKKDAAEEEESGKVNDGQTVQNTEDKPLKNNGQISEINGKADGSIAALNGHCEDKIPAEDNDAAETEKPLKEEETPLENVEISKKKLPDEVDANEVEPVEIIEMEEKQNDINEGFRKFFSNIGLKLTVKKGSGEKGETEVPKEGPNIPEDVKDNVQEAKNENEEQNVDLNAAQEATDYHSTTCPSLTDGTSENFLEHSETKTTETKEEAESDNADAETTSPALSEDAHQDTIPEEEPCPKSPLVTDEIVVESPFRRFFTTGIFSSLRKKKKFAEDETMEKELVDMGENETAEIAEQALEEQQQDKEEITLDTEAVTAAKGLGEAEILPAVSIQVKDEVKSPSMDTSNSIVNEAEILNSQEKEKVQASPLKKLMSGSSFKNLSKKQKGKKSSDAKISDSQQQVSDQFLSSTDSAEYQKEESPAQPSVPAAEDEDSAWVAFKKLVTPKKRIKKSSLSNEQAQISGSVDEAKLSEEQQISDHSTDEGKKRKDSSVSWEAVLCGSGRRRSRKSSDSEEETPQTDAGDDSGLKQDAESPIEISNEAQEIQEGSPPEGDGESTWKSFKKLVTPKTKAKDDESKDSMPSDNQVTQADSTFSIKKLLPGRRKRKPAEKPDQVSSDEADKEVASGDEDSETPAVIPLSEFEADETGVHTQTKTDIESYVPEETNNELQQESVAPCDSFQIETEKVQDNEDALENEASKIPATVEEPDDLTELISKYQQLSDIPEEGILTETMATPASAIEEAARDDTIAEDLVEFTSEAVTAPEPFDATVTDETEMISAVSQLPDSSKTSGNITPVPAEYNVMGTELLLGQVAENISASTHAVAVMSEEPSSGRIVSSVSPQILETFEKEQPKILEIHKGLDEMVINTDLNTDPIDAINELAATVQTESVPDVNKAISTEIVSEVPTEEFDNAEIGVDEVHEVSVIQGQENIKELEATDDSQHVPESVSEEMDKLPQETSPEGKDVAQDEGYIFGADQVEEDTSKTETQEAESAPFVADENKDGSMEHEAQTLAEKMDEIIKNVTEESQVEDQPSVVVVDDLEGLTNREKDAIASKADTVQSLKKETPSSEDIPPTEAGTDESKQREHLTEVTIEPENTETQTEAPKTDHYEVTDVLDVEQKATVETEEDSDQSSEEIVPSSEDIPPVESIDESKQTAEHLTEVTDEPETKEPQPDVCEVTEASEVVQATLEPDEDSVQKEIKSSEDIQSADPVTDESKQTGEYLTKVTDEIENGEPPVEVPEEMEVVQAATFDSEEDSVQKEIQSTEDVRSAEPVTDECKQTAEHLTEVTDEPETKEPQPDVCEVTEASEVFRATLEPDEDSVQKEIKSSEDIQSADLVTDESKQTEEYLTKVTDEIQNEEPLVEVPEEMEVVQAATFDSEEDSVQKEIQSTEDVRSAEPVTDESKQTAEHLTEVTDEPETKEPQPDACEVTEVSEVVQATLEPDEDSVEKQTQSSEDVQSADPVTDESKQTGEHLTKVTDEIQNVEPPVEVPEEMEVLQAATFDSEEDSVQKEIQSTEDVRSAEPLMDESKQTAEHFTEVTDEPEPKEPQSDLCEVTEASEVVQTATLEPDEDSVQKQTQSSQEVQSADLVTDESKQTGEHLTELTDEIQNEEPPVEVPEEMEVVQAATFDSEEDSVQKEVQSTEDVRSVEPVPDESKQTAEHLTEPETKEPQPDDCEVTEVSEVVQTATLESDEDSVEKQTQSSEDVQSADLVTDESKQTGEHLTELTDEIQNEEPPVEIPEEMEVVQAATFDSEEDSVQKEIQSTEDVRSVEPVPDESKQTAEHLTEPENKEPQPDACEVTEVSEVVQTATLESDEDSVQKQTQSSVDVQSADLVTDESKQTAEHLTEPETKEPQPDSEVTEVSEVVQTATFDSEERSIQSMDKEVISEDIPPAETDQPKETEMVPLTQDKVESLDDSKTKDVQEPAVVQAITLDSEAGSPQVIEEEIISKDIVTVETVTDELRQETDELEKVEPVEAETSLPNIVPETDGKVSKSNVVAQSVEEISTQELETLLEDIPKSDAGSVTDETEKKVMAQSDQDLEINKYQKTESISQDVQAEHEDRKAEAVEETVTAAHIPSGAEACYDQVLEETVFCEEILAPCVDSAEVSGEPKHEEDPVQVSVEGEKAGELQGTEMNTAAAEHAVVMQVITCNLKDAAIPDVLTEETPEIQEHSIEMRANELEVKDPVETTTPLEKDDVNDTAEEGSVVVMMHVPSVEFDDNHRIQVQVLGVAIKSAENAIDTLIEVGVTEAKEVIDVCHATLEKVEPLSASPAFEEEVNNEENNLTVQEVIQHVKENLPETTPESPEPDLLQKEVMKQAALTEIVQGGSSELENQKITKDSAGARMEEKDEGHVIPAEQKASEAQLQISDLSLDIPTLDREEEDLEETKAELQKSEVCVTTEAATASSEELSKKKNAENTTETQSTQSQIIGPSNTGLVAPQNTGMISSIGNVESPSSLSLELKLNIQFGQPKAPASPPPLTEPMKQPDMSTVAVQAVEAVEPTNVVNVMQRVESEKQIELMEAAVQTTEITEPAAVISYQPKLQVVQKIETTQPVEQMELIIPRNREAETAEPVKLIIEPAEKNDLTERAMMSYQPVLQDVGIQAMETIEPVEQIQLNQSVIPNIQAAETIEPVRQKEKRGVLISHPAVFEPFFEACVKGKKAEEPIKQTEEENDDVWLDAEEDIYTQAETEGSRLEAEEPTEPQAESEQEDKEKLEPEFEIAPDSKAEDGESHQRVRKTGGTCEIESEGEDFAVALEFPETTISVPPAEWD